MRSLKEERMADRPEKAPLFRSIPSHKEALKVGVLFSGGPAPGGNNVVIGLFEALKKMHAGSEVIGFLGGPSGLLENKALVIEEEACKKRLNQGGFDFLGTGRTKIEKEEDFEAAKKTMESWDLDGMVFIGGDDTNTNAFHLAQFLRKKGSKTVVVGVPKTIDGDLKSGEIEASFGFDTACKVYSEMIGNICLDAKSSLKYWHYIKLMGRKASHVTLECALNIHPNLAFIGEEIEAKGSSLEEIVEEIATLIEERKKQGKSYGVILIPEGLIEFIPEMKALVLELSQKGAEELSPPSQKLLHSFPTHFQEALLSDRDPHGNVQLSKIETEKLLSAMVNKRLGAKGHNALHHYFGYEGRCAFPSHFDATYTYNLGMMAAFLVKEGKSGVMATVKNLFQEVEKWQPGGVPLQKMMVFEERKGVQKEVIGKALVDIKGAPFAQFAESRKLWRLGDDYQLFGPMQFSGNLKSLRTKTLELEALALSQ